MDLMDPIQRGAGAARISSELVSPTPSLPCTNAATRTIQDGWMHEALRSAATVFPARPSGARSRARALIDYFFLFLEIETDPHSRAGSLARPTFRSCLKPAVCRSRLPGESAPRHVVRPPGHPIPPVSVRATCRRDVRR